MATTATHARIIEEVYESFSDEKQGFLLDNINDLKTFAQSMDSFYFYKLYSFSKKNQQTRKTASRFHTTYINDFFVTMIEYIKFKGYEEVPQVIAFLYGTISHFATDSTMHPYIVYKTGQFRKKRKASWKYNGLHHDLEMNFDRHIIEKVLRKNPFKYKFFSFFINDLGPELTDVLNHTFREVFGISNFAKKYRKSLKDMKFFLRFLRYDPHGIKLLFYRFGNLFRRGRMDLRIISYKYHSYRERDYFNVDKMEWNYPTDNTIKSNKSMFELYDDSIKKTKNIIKEVDKYLYKNKKMELEELFDDLSYSTGVDWKKKEKAIFFSF